MAPHPRDDLPTFTVNVVGLSRGPWSKSWACESVRVAGYVLGVADANVKYMPWCQKGSEKQHAAANSYLEAILSTRFPRAAF